MSQIITCMKIRHAVVSALKAANIPTVGDKVFSSRDINAWPKEGNFICVYTNSHSFEDQGTSPVIYQAQTTLTVDAIIQGDKVRIIDGHRVVIPIDDQMDEISDLICEALIPSPEPVDGPLYQAVGIKHFVRLQSIDTTFTGDGDMDRGNARLTFVYTWSCVLPNGEAENDYLLNENTLKVKDGDDAKNMVWETDVRNR